MGDEPKSSEQEKQESFDVLDNVAAEEESHDGDTEPDEDNNSVELPSEQGAAPALTTVRRHVSHSVDVPKNKNTSKDLGKAKHVLAASEQPLSSQVSVQAHHSLAEERQALKLRERQKKTTDAVNEMRRRLAAMGIMPRDKDKDAETVSSDSKSTLTDKENANATGKTETNEEGTEQEEGVAAQHSSQTTQRRVKPTGWSNSNPGSNSTSSEDNSKAEEQCPASIPPSLSESPKAVDKVLQLSAPEHSPVPISASRLEGSSRIR